MQRLNEKRAMDVGGWSTQETWSLVTIYPRWRTTTKVLNLRRDFKTYDENSLGGTGLAVISTRTGRSTLKLK